MPIHKLSVVHAHLIEAQFNQLKPFDGGRNATDTNIGLPATLFRRAHSASSREYHNTRRYRARILANNA